jgi:hypothetical protein
MESLVHAPLFLRTASAASSHATPAVPEEAHESWRPAAETHCANRSGAAWVATRAREMATATWVTEASAGAPRGGQGPRAADGQDACLGADSLGRRRRVGAVFQYTFGEKPEFPVGLISAGLLQELPVVGGVACHALWCRVTAPDASGRVCA